VLNNSSNCLHCRKYNEISFIFSVEKINQIKNNTNLPKLCVMFNPAEPDWSTYFGAYYHPQKRWMIYDREGLDNLLNFNSYRILTEKDRN